MTKFAFQKTLLLCTAIIFISGCSTESAKISAKSECNGYKRFSAAYEECINNIDTFYDETYAKD